MVKAYDRAYSVIIMELTPVKLRPQFASLIAAKKTGAAAALHVQGIQERRDAVAKTVTATDAAGNTRQNLNLTDTFEADDTFAHTEGQKLRGGRIDLVI